MTAKTRVELLLERAAAELIVQNLITTNGANEVSAADVRAAYAVFSDLGENQMDSALNLSDDTLDVIIEGVANRHFTDAEKTKLAGLTQAPGYVLATWGADLQNTGRFPAINGAENGPEIPGLGVSASAQVPADGTIDTLTYYSAAGDNTTVFKIIHNGAVAYTFNCVAPYGRETGIGVPVAVGDNVAIEYDAGTKPAGGIYAMYIS
tara:strand:- start:357 stop:977 length:621 start_codon:yes stop_codon:yes gene_type:complete